MSSIKIPRFLYRNRHLKNTNGFTLVEMIVTVVIIGILSAIGFVLYISEINVSRDATRIANTKALYQGSKSLVARGDKIPFPDRGVALQASGIHIGYQGYAGQKQSTDMGFDDKNFQDPQTKIPYTYRLNKNRDKSQFLTYLESDKYQDTTVFDGSQLIETANAADTNIYPYVVGDPLGVILEKDTQAPIQESTNTGVFASGNIIGFSGSTAELIGSSYIDIASSSSRESTEIISGPLGPDIAHHLIQEELISTQINTQKRVHNLMDSTQELACSIKNGDVECWGKGIYKRDGTYANKPGFTEEQIAVETNNNTTCSLGVSGRVSCWGYGFTGPSNNPIPAENLNSTNSNWNNMESISMSSTQLCGIIKSTKRVLCAGNSSSPYTQQYTMISAGNVSPSSSINFCGVTSSGSLYCENQYHRFENSSYGEITSISVGTIKYACLTNKSGEVSCWDTSTPARTPLTVSAALSGAKNVKVFDAFGNRDICVEKITGGVLCWNYQNNTFRPFVPDSLSDYSIMNVGLCTTDSTEAQCHEYREAPVITQSWYYPLSHFAQIYNKDVVDIRQGLGSIWIKNNLGWVRDFSPSTQISGSSTQNITNNGTCKQSSTQGLYDCGSGSIPGSNILTKAHSASAGFTTSWLCGADSSKKGHCFMQQQTKLKINWPEINNREIVDIVGGNGFGCALSSTGATLCRTKDNNSYNGPIGTSMLATNGEKICAVYNNDTQIACWTGYGNTSMNAESATMAEGVGTLVVGSVGAGTPLTCLTTKNQKTYCRGSIDNQRSSSTFSEIAELSGKDFLIVGQKYVCGWSGDNYSNLRCRGDVQK